MSPGVPVLGQRLSRGGCSANHVVAQRENFESAWLAHAQTCCLRAAILARMIHQ